MGDCIFASTDAQERNYLFCHCCTNELPVSSSSLKVRYQRLHVLNGALNGRSSRHSQGEGPCLSVPSCVGLTHSNHALWLPGLAGLLLKDEVANPNSVQQGR